MRSPGLDGDDSPIPDYYRGSSTSVLKQLATLLGTGGPGLSDEALPRVQAWWTWRLAAVTSATEPDGRTELIDTLPALAASGRFPDEWILQQFHVLLDASG
ncbi:hypothetical protein [Kitasatospora sp. NPDC088779]|uniref:hypothetical protein n=1 Tax=Kitasatospora sp. NPDC088779 TaxID=3154964 RepID=UPI0034326FAB